MQCTRCSAEIPPQSQFCLRCGTPLNASAVPQRPAPFNPAPAAPAKNNTPLLATVGVLALALVILGGRAVKGKLTHKPESDAPTGLVQAPKKAAGGGLVQKPQESAPTEVVEKPAPAEQGPPQEVLDYLDFLKRIEEKRKALQHDQMKDLFALMATLPADDIKKYMNFEQGAGDPGADKSQAPTAAPMKSTSEIAEQWNQLAAAFSEKVPPVSCKVLHDSYYGFLGETQKETIQVYTMLSKAQSDPRSMAAEAYGMQGQSGKIDGLMRDADGALADVCDKYKIRKRFDITDSEGMGGLMRSK